MIESLLAQFINSLLKSFINSETIYNIYTYFLNKNIVINLLATLN